MYRSLCLLTIFSAIYILFPLLYISIAVFKYGSLEKSLNSTDFIKYGRLQSIISFFNGILRGDYKFNIYG